MATTKTTKSAARDNLSICWDALTAELGTPVEKTDLEEYLTRLEGIVTKVRAIKKEHAKAAAVIASQKSRAARKARIAEAMALLEAKEAAEAAA
ncbi:hypothetical protein V8Z69_18355 [Microbacterium aurugineum]|uniref:hypothetical protein n=1 Tax=Microbacterium aurugineum TaxID=2851642 RepID=UPI0039BE5FE3